MSAKRIVISPDMKPIKGHLGHVKQVGYKVEFRGIPDKPTRTLHYKQHHKAQHQAVWWSRCHDDAEITERIISYKGGCHGR